MLLRAARPRAAVRGLDLDRRMINVEVVGADVLAAHEHLVVRRPRREDDVARHRRPVGRELPDVDVVHVAHALDVLQALLQAPDVHVRRRALQQNIDRLAHEAHRRPDHDQREEQRHERVGDLPRRPPPDDGARQDHAQVLQQIT